MYNKFSNEEKSAIVQKYWAGQSVASLCQQHGVSRSTLYSWLKPFRQLDASSKCLYSKYTQKDYTDLKRHANKLERILEVLRNCDCSPNSPLEARISAFQELQNQYSARTLCDALNIPRSTYHKRIIRGEHPTAYEAHRQEIMEQIRIIFEESEQRFGSDKILAALQQKGIRTSKKYILSLMHEMGIESIAVRAKKNYKSLGKKKNIVQRQFHADAPNMIWVSDVTCFKVNDHYLYVCVILDLFSRKVVSYRISLRNSTQLITTTFRNAFAKRGEPHGLIFHSDRGSQYTSAAFRKLLVSCGVTQSFSHSGRPHDNAVAESFFSFLKREEIYRRYYQSDRDFRVSIDRYMSFYNSERPHRNNNYKSPDQLEQDYISNLSK